jgi:hypothetical protein
MPTSDGPSGGDTRQARDGAGAGATNGRIPRAGRQDDNGAVIRERTLHRRMNRLAWLAVALLMLGPLVGRLCGLGATPLRTATVCVPGAQAMPAASSDMGRHPTQIHVDAADCVYCPLAASLALPSVDAMADAVVARSGVSPRAAVPSSVTRTGPQAGCRGPPAASAASA